MTITWEPCDCPGAVGASKLTLRVVARIRELDGQGMSRVRIAAACGCRNRRCATRFARLAPGRLTEGGQVAASWQLPGPDFHRQATTSLRTASSAATSQRHLQLCWAHESSGLVRLASCIAGSVAPHSPSGEEHISIEPRQVTTKVTYGS